MIEEDPRVPRPDRQTREYYPWSFIKRVSGYTTAHDTYVAAQVDSQAYEPSILSGALAGYYAFQEFVLPVTTRFMMDDTSSQDYKPMSRLLKTVGLPALDLATLGLVTLEGLDNLALVAARKLTVNCATHMGIDFVQSLPTQTGLLKYRYLRLRKKFSQIILNKRYKRY